MGEGGKNPGSPNNYAKFGQLIIRKSIKIISTRSHILRLKYTKFYSQHLFVRSFVACWRHTGSKTGADFRPRVSSALDAVLHSWCMNVWLVGLLQCGSSFGRSNWGAATSWDQERCCTFSELGDGCVETQHQIQWHLEFCSPWPRSQRVWWNSK